MKRIPHCTEKLRTKALPVAYAMQRWLRADQSLPGEDKTISVSCQESGVE